MRWIRIALAEAPLALLLAEFLTPHNVGALPLFARKNSVPCTTCHLAFPRLNAFGMAFRQNGYRMPGVKGESPWEAKEFPLSVVGNVGYLYTSTDTLNTSGGRDRSAVSSFVQNTSEFHSAGTLAQNVTFHFDNNFAGVNGPLTSGMAFVQFDDLAKDGVLNLKTGIYDAEIPYLSDSRRTTWTHYLSPVTLAAEGIELNGTKSGWTYAAGLNNSARVAVASSLRRIASIAWPDSPKARASRSSPGRPAREASRSTPASCGGFASWRVIGPCSDG